MKTPYSCSAGHLQEKIHQIFITQFLCVAHVWRHGTKPHTQKRNHTMRFTWFGDVPTSTMEENSFYFALLNLGLHKLHHRYVTLNNLVSLRCTRVVPASTVEENSLFLYFALLQVQDYIISLSHTARYKYQNTPYPKSSPYLTQQTNL